MHKLLLKVKQRIENYKKGHDFTHIERVIENAKMINQNENQPSHLVFVLALTHDLYDEKFNNNGFNEQDFRSLINEIELTENEVQLLISDLRNFGYRGGFDENKLSPIGQIVSDADRLDAMGAIGIARAMMYGSILYNKQIYEPVKTIDEYRDKDRPIIFHFYDKLFNLKDLMFTEMGKKLAVERHEFMELYISQLKSEIGDDLF